MSPCSMASNSAWHSRRCSVSVALTRAVAPVSLHAIASRTASRPCAMCSAIERRRPVRVAAAHRLDDEVVEGVGAFDLGGAERAERLEHERDVDGAGQHRGQAVVAARRRGCRRGSAGSRRGAAARLRRSRRRPRGGRRRTRRPRRRARRARPRSLARSRPRRRRTRAGCAARRGRRPPSPRAGAPSRPGCARSTTSPSASSMRSASRTGVRESPSSSAMRCSTSRCPGG